MPGSQGVERHLDVLVERLALAADNPAARALLIEARRLKSIIDNWRSVPPAPNVREEMLARVSHISAAASDMLPQSASRRDLQSSQSGSHLFQTGVRVPPAPESRGFSGGGVEETVITEGGGALPTTPLDVMPVTLKDDIDPNLATLRDPFSVRADAYRALRYRLTQRGDPKVIGVTSAGRREGKTTAAINLAASLREGARGRVLVLEGNLRHPSIASMLGFMPPVCFEEQLRRHRKEPLEPWVAAEVLPQLHIMAVNPVNKFSPLLDPIAFSIAIDRLRLAGYDYIVVDTPAVLETADVNLIADSVDGFLMVAMGRKSDGKSVKRGIDQLGSRTFLGTLLLE